MEKRSAPHAAPYPPPCNCGAPRSALRLAFIAAFVALIVGLLIAGARMAGAAPATNPFAGDPSTACPAPPIAAQHRYRMSAKIRPLLFWIGRDNVGGAQVVWRRGPEDARGFELLIGSDPERAPRRFNRWGYIAEAVQGSEACVVGVMKQTSEESIDEAQSRLTSDAQQGRYVFKAIRAAASPNEARARVTTVNVTRDMTYRDLDALLDVVTSESRTSESRTKVTRPVPLPAGTRPGFLVALAELIHVNADQYRALARDPHARAPLTYVYNGNFYDLRLSHSELLREWSFGGRTATNVVRAEFQWRDLTSGEKSRFELVYGTDGPLAEIPLHATYQPRWWFEVELALDDAGGL